MNAPERWELFVLPEGVSKVAMTPDTKQPNCATFKVACEDHTLGNLLCYHLQQHPSIVFAGYRVPHPLEHNFELRVQCQQGPGQKSPADVLQDVINQLIGHCTTVEASLKNELSKF
jgi:DNA-directed RNA polymerase II subunit RPB11